MSSPDVANSVVAAAYLPVAAMAEPALSRGDLRTRGRRPVGHPLVVSLSYARRQQWRRLKKAASHATAAAVLLVGAVAAVDAHERKLGLSLLLLSGVLALTSRHALRLAARSRVGAESESQVRRVLKQLEGRGWSVRHAVDWPGGGDLDHVLRSPSGMGFVIETKTLRYKRTHVLRTVDAARWLARRRRRYPRGVVPVVCVTRARRVERFDDEALVVSLDCLMTALRETRTGRRASWSARRSPDGAGAVRVPVRRG